MDPRRGHFRGVTNMNPIDRTHDPKRRSWVESANRHAEFPIQNLPLGVFSPREGKKRGGVAIGDEIFDIAAAVRAGLFAGAARRPALMAADQTLNQLMALPPSARQALRQRLSDLLSADGADRSAVEGLKAELLHPAADCTLHLPAHIGNYTDFLTSIHHAANTGRLFRGGQDPVPTNFRHLPIAYHGRPSFVGARFGRSRTPPAQAVLVAARRTADLRTMREARLRI